MMEISVALILSALAAYSAQRQALRAAELALADVQADALSAYGKALSRYVDDNYGALQSNVAVVVNGVNLPVGSAAGQSLKPTVAQLLAMGYLPNGFSNQSVAVDGAGYDNIIERLPGGCSGAGCQVSGLAYLTAPVTVRGSAVEDSVVIGEIFNRIGGLAATSMTGSAANVVGNGGTYTHVNPLPGNPAGVVAYAFGYGLSSTSQYVRIGDTRDPSLAGPLTVSGQIQTSSGIDVMNAGVSCVNIDKTGVITINCTGRLNAATGLFSAAADGSKTVNIDPGFGVAASGRMAAQAGLATASATLFDASDPNTITVKSGDMFIKDGSGGTMLRITNGAVMATSSVSATQLYVRNQVTEGTACAATADTQVAALSGGGLASCVGGTWFALQRVGTKDAACSIAGALAVDSATGMGLMCRGHVWASSNELASRFVLMETDSVTNGSVVPKPTCPGTGSGAVPLIILVPVTDAPEQYNVGAGTFDGVDRYAVDLGATWQVKIVSTGPGNAPMTGSTAIAHLYCYYPTL